MAKEKKYNEYQKNNFYVGDLFSDFDKLYVKDKDKYSNTIELYDLVPKYYFGEQDELRVNGLLKILTRTFVYKKKELDVEISPANILQKDGNTKSFYPSFREEVVEDALRKFAIDNRDKMETLDDLISIRFTLYELWKELKNNNHEYNYQQIKESLEILSKTNIKVKHTGKRGRVEMVGNMFEGYGVADENETMEENASEEYGRNITYFVRFSYLVTKSIKDKTWRLINYKQCMSYKRAISKYLHKRISHLFLNGTPEIPYNILLSTLFRDGGFTLSNVMYENIRKLKNSLEEMITIGSIDRYDLEYKMVEGKPRKVEDVKIRLWISDNFCRDIKRGFLPFRNEQSEQKMLEWNNNDHPKIGNSISNNIKDTDKIDLNKNNTNTVLVDMDKNNINNIQKEQKDKQMGVKEEKKTNEKNKEIERIKEEEKNIENERQEIFTLLKSMDKTIENKEIEKIINNKNEEELLAIKNNIEVAKSYIDKKIKDNEDYSCIAILKKSIKDNWQFDSKEKREREYKKEKENEIKNILPIDNGIYTKVLNRFATEFGAYECKNHFDVRRGFRISLYDNRIIFFFNYVETKILLDYRIRMEKIAKELFPGLSDIGIKQL
ncbi:MAG: hypothetical protein LBQ13_01555 [Endomicrobium sp.]|jgi:hypothetical protein|nr:hypothetical protein [Endomicrobium sp.]